jgi:predicted O-methyltransferase YrrM
MANRNDLIKVPMTIEWPGKQNRKYFLKHLIDTNKFETIVEVGVRDGRTTFYLLEHCPSIKKYYAIDTNVSLFANKEEAIKFKDKLVAIQGFSFDVANQIKELADIVFIDADHSYESVKKDIKAYTPKVKHGGMLSGHDIDFPGVNKAVNELIPKYGVGPNNVWFINVS